MAIENDCFLNVDSKFDAENICRIAEQKDRVVQVVLKWNFYNILFLYIFEGFAQTKSYFFCKRPPFFEHW